MKSGRLFICKVEVPQLSEFKEELYGLLDRVQLESTIESSIDMKGVYGIKRLIHRGVTTHALNMKFDENTSMQ